MKIFLTKKFYLLLAGLILGSVFLFKACSSAKGDKGLGYGKVLRQDLIQRVTISGTVEPKRKTLVTAPYKGYIRKIYVKLGENIKAGDPVATVGTTLILNDQVFPLRAPFDGKVVQVNKEEGEYIKESDPSDFIARIDDLSQIFISSSVPEMDRLKIKKDQEAIVKASAVLDDVYQGIVREISLAAREKDRWERATAAEYPLRLEILNPDEKLKSGMSVLIDIITTKKEKVLTLRHEYIYQDESGDYVILADGTRKDVKIGVQNEEASEIIEGVKEGQSVRRVNFAEMIRR